MDQPIIRLSHVSKIYRIGTLQPRYRTLRESVADFWKNLFAVDKRNNRTFLSALDDISFDIKPGEVIGVIGRNGAGKSTLLKLLSHITNPSRGRIEMNGRVGSLLEVGTGFHPELTGKENIYLNGAILGMKRSEIRNKFDEIISFAELESFVDTAVKYYSSGMYMRLAFAVAAHLEPEILLVDEVLAVGDVAFQKKCLGKMGDVARQGRTILFVSHNMTAISNLCQRAILLKSGRVDFDGEVQQGVRKYLNEVDHDLVSEDTKLKIYQLPEDPVLKLLDLRVSQPGRPTSSFLSNEDIEVSIEYSVRQETAGLRVGFDLIVQENGAVVFRSFHDDAQSSKQEIPPGTYVSSAIIPADLLAAKTYVVSLTLGIHNVRWIVFEKIALPMTVVNIGGVNSNYADSRPGMVMPYIQWVTTLRAEG